MELLSYLLGKKSSSGGGGTPTKYAPRRISFYYYYGNDLTYEVENLDTKNITEMDYMFYYCANITSLDLSNFDTSKLTNIDYIFNRCKKLMFIDMRTFDFTKIESFTNMVSTTSGNGPANDCLIIVKDDTAKTVITTNFSRLTNVKTVTEYEASL